MTELNRNGNVDLSNNNILFLFIHTNIKIHNICINNIKIYDRLIFFPFGCAILRSWSNININSEYFIKIYKIKEKTNMSMLYYIKNINLGKLCSNIQLLQNNFALLIRIYIEYPANINTPNYNNKLKNINIKSDDLIFIYKIKYISDKIIMLQLNGITKIDSDDNIFINIKFDNLNNIYDKYIKCFENICKFINKKYDTYLYDEREFLKYFNVDKESTIHYHHISLV